MDLERRVRELEWKIEQLQHQSHATKHEVGGTDEVRQIRSVRSGLAADRPASGARGDVYWETDTPALNIYTGSTWFDMGPMVEHHTADDTLTKEEHGTVHTNLGEDGAMTLTLPQDASTGCTFRFVVMTAQQLRVDPGAAGAVYINGAKQTDDKYVWADAINESIMLVADGNGDWVALFTIGTWGVEA